MGGELPVTQVFGVGAVIYVVFLAVLIGLAAYAKGGD